MNIWLLIYILFIVYRNSAWPYALFIMAYAILTEVFALIISAQLMLSEDAEHH